MIPTTTPEVETPDKKTVEAAENLAKSVSPLIEQLFKAEEK